MSAGDLSPDPPTWPAKLVAERDELERVRAALLSANATVTAERDAWRDCVVIGAAAGEVVTGTPAWRYLEQRLQAAERKLEELGLDFTELYQAAIREAEEHSALPPEPHPDDRDHEAK